MKNPGLQRSDSTAADLQVAAAPSDPLTLVYDCWKTIGVEGNGTCRELAAYIHCRNCPVYSAASLQLLDRPLPADYRREWTEHFARKKKLFAPPKTSAILFRIGQEWLALPTRIFQEVAERRMVHSLPHRRQGIVLGLVNVRGELLICVSLDRLLGLERETPRDKARTVYDRLLVVNWNGSRLSFPVDEVHGTHRFHRDDLQEPPATVARSALTYTQGIFPWRERTAGFIDAELLFSALNRSLT